MTDWAIPQQAKLKYTQLFNLHDRSRSGFLSGLQCRDILLQSGLARNVLAEIWNLSDIDGDGQLNREEFILAMHLTNHVRSGLTLPSELPVDLVPPSFRRTRSVSSTSVHSVTSAGSATSVGASGVPVIIPGATMTDEQLHKVASESSSSSLKGSVLNSNSFEDKRRENFERGRAELERRRLNIIEQQSSVLKEQLEASKKHVAEAKSKIDAMRSDRDTKMGLITSLEAQVQALMDKKAYLSHEEASLIAIAKDLNMINSNRNELDQLDTQAQLQQISQMKLGIEAMKREKEQKDSEMQEFSVKLEESKRELKTLSETIAVSFETYKQKVEQAKVLRAQFIEENRTPTADLDSVWDAVPAFAPSESSSKSNTGAISFNDDIWATNGSPNDRSSAAFTPLAPLAKEKQADLLGSFNAFSSNFDEDGFGSLNQNATPSSITTTTPTQLTSTATAISTSVETRATASSPTTLCTMTSVNNTNNKTSQNVQTGNKKYRALYSFIQRNPDELTINPGDIIVGADQVCEPGWLSGRLDGKMGLFPEAYVELMTDEVGPNDLFNNNIHANAMDSLVLSNTESDVLHRNVEPAAKYKVVYAFEARNDDELTMNPGDMITAVEGSHEPGWLMGEMNGRVGLFPEAYVEKMVEPEQDKNNEGAPLQRMSSVGSLRSKKSRSKKAEVASVIANYKALGQEQLSLEKGQLVLIRRKMDSGWWEGEIQVKGKKKQFGWFPASYVKMLSNSAAT